MTIERRSLVRFATALVSTGLACAGAWLWLRSRTPAVATVEVVDRRAEFEALLEQRALGANPAAYTDEDLVVSVEDRAEFVRLTHRDQKGQVEDPLCIYRLAPGIDRWQAFPEHPDGGWRVHTNSLGLRNDEEVLSEPPDLRLIVTGDSHTEGTCANSDSFTALLGERLSATGGELTVEALNAGVGGYNVYHYLGVLERYLELRPDVFLVAVYGGNDFSAAMKLQRFFKRRGKPSSEPWTMPRVHRAGARGSDLEPQQLTQLIYLLNNPGDVPLAIDTLAAISRRMEQLCAAAGVALVFLYLPPPLCGQPDRYPQESAGLRAVLAEAGLEREPSEQIADGWLASLQAEGIPHLDLRPAIRAAGEPLYWRSDSHLNLAGHRLVAELAGPLVLDALAAREGR